MYRKSWKSLWKKKRFLLIFTKNIILLLQRMVLNTEIYSCGGKMKTVILWPQIGEVITLSLQPNEFYKVTKELEGPHYHATRVEI